MVTAAAQDQWRLLDVQAHDTRLYVDTAALVDESDDPSVATWRDGSEVFFAGDTHGNPVVRDFVIERVAP